ncbi:MAG: hypothetical protein QOF60_3250 [Actinomycetota bacterium]|nr:hypothetical protein [Actinomycetota bacterium]
MAAVVALALGGCTKDTGGAVGDGSSVSSSSSSSTPSSSSSTPSSASIATVPGSTISTTAGPGAGAPVAVAADGLEITSGSKTSRFTYSGKASVRTVKDGLRPYLGDPFKETDADCDAGKLHWVRWKAIDVYFSDGQLAGWGLPFDGTPALKTAGGIGIGSSRPEIQRAFPNVTVEESTLGTEWFATGTAPDTGLSGIFASDAPDARNEAMWSGRTCLAR